MDLSSEYIKNEMAAKGITSYSTDVIEITLTKTNTYYLPAGDKFYYLLNSEMDSNVSINSETGYIFTDTDGRYTYGYKLKSLRGQVKIKFRETPTIGQLTFLRVTPKTYAA